jgi:hypothetical protein
MFLPLAASRIHTAEHNQKTRAENVSNEVSKIRESHGHVINGI